MFVRRAYAVLSIVLLAVPCAARAQQQTRQTCDTAIPPNVSAGMLTAEMLSLLRASETFRAQCGRIAAEPRVRVRLDVTSTLDTGRAQTEIRRYRSGSMQADVVLLFGENYAELLAHEFEHVLEQLDGVNLRAEAAVGRAWVLPSGAFETRRAFTVGVQVLHEIDAPHAHAPATMTSTR